MRDFTRSWKRINPLDPWKVNVCKSGMNKKDWKHIFKMVLEYTCGNMRHPSIKLRNWQALILIITGGIYLMLGHFYGHLSYLFT